MISIYWGKPGDGMKLNRLKTYPKVLRARCRDCGRFVNRHHGCFHCDSGEGGC
ncbi:TPA: hypothetical protein MNK97_005288 [Klebsiella pneumoniae]|nr:hypothetical protein [Klebsiella pneumoniae]